MMHYKIVFDYLKDKKFKETLYKYRKEMTSFVGLMGVEHAETLISVTQDIFKDDEEVLNLFNEYCYIRFKEYPDLTKLVENNENKPRISVIMPANNFKDSIQSVIDQSFDDFELICYNNFISSYLKDLSRDNPQIIIKDDIKSIEDAFNIARGKYVYFFNPKGKLEKNALERLYENAILNNSDIVLFKLAKLLQDQSIDYSVPLYNLDEIFNKEFDFKNFTFNYKTISGHIFYNVFVPWHKFFRKEFLDENHDLMFDNIDNENIIFNIKSLFKTKHISYAPEFYYIYRSEEYTNNYFNKYIIDIIDSVETFLKENDYFDEFKFEFNKFKVNYISKNIIPSQSEEFYKQVKEIFSRMDMTLIEEMPYSIMKRHNWVIYSNTLKEYFLKNQIDDNTTETFNEFHLRFEVYDLKYLNSKLESKNKKLVKQKNKLTKDNKALKAKNKKLNKLNKEILSSKSWKITEPIRKFKNI
jgi:hypothetical protein